MDENISHILDQDTWLPATPDITKDGYIKIDLNKVDLVTYSLNKRFRQIENGAILSLWFYDGNVPHQLNKDKSSVTVYGLDSTEKIKVVSAAPDDAWQSGRVKISLPSQMFASAGQFKRCVIQVKTDDQVLATINFNIDVLPNDFANLNIGSKPFASEIDDKIKQTLQDFEDIARSTTEQYKTLKALADVTSAEIKANNIVTKDTYDIGIGGLNAKVDALPKWKKYDKTAINFTDPYSDWNGVGSTSINAIDDVVFLSVSTQSYKQGSVIGVLPSELRPKIEKVGVGISMDGDGHDAQPVAMSIMPDGTIIVENNTHDHSKILFVTSYSLIDTGNGNGDSGSSEGPSKITNPETLKGSWAIALTASTNAYRGNGEVSRILENRNSYAVDERATLNGQTVYRVSTDEWVVADNNVAIIQPFTGKVTPTTTTPQIVNQFGEDISYPLTIQEYAVDRQLNIHGRTYYEISLNGFVNSSQVKIDTGDGNEHAGGGSGSSTGTSKITKIETLKGNWTVATTTATNAYRGNGEVSRILGNRDSFATDERAMLNGQTVYRVSTDEWVVADNNVAIIQPFTGKVTPTTTTPRILNQFGEDVSYPLTIQEYAVDKQLNIHGKTYYEISLNGFINSSQVKMG